MSIKQVLYIASYENVRFKGGIYTIANKVIEHSDFFYQSGVELHFISSCQIARDIKNVGKLSFDNIRNLKMLWLTVKKELRNNSIDLIYINTSNSHAFLKDVWLCKQIKQKFGIKTLLHVHFSRVSQILPKPFLFRELTKFWLKHYVDSLVVLNNFTLSEFKAIQYNGTIEVIPNFFIEEETRKQSNDGILKLLYLGTIDKRKGFDKCLAIIKKLKDENVGVTLNVAGNWLNEKFKIQMLKEIEKLELQDEITFHGFLEGEGKRRLVRESECLLLLSKAEGMAMAMLECMEAGLAIITSKSPENKEFFIDSSIQLYDIDTTEAICEQLMLYANSKKLLSSIGFESKRIASDYTLNKFLNRSVKLMTSV